MTRERRHVPDEPTLANILSQIEGLVEGADDMLRRGLRASALRLARRALEEWQALGAIMPAYAPTSRLPMRIRDLTKHAARRAPRPILTELGARQGAEPGMPLRPRGERSGAAHAPSCTI